MFRQLQDKQRVLDKHIMDKMGIKSHEPLFQSRVQAFTTEVHEYWADNTTEEFIDALHFAMSIANYLGLDMETLYMEQDIQYNVNTAIVMLNNSVGPKFKYWSTKKVDKNKRLEAFRAVCNAFVFPNADKIGWDEVMRVYDMKNAVNYERIAGGY